MDDVQGFELRKLTDEERRAYIEGALAAFDLVAQGARPETIELFRRALERDLEELEELEP